jgi:uncharacterized protein YdeI (YjbR/CyaY-like superfamily)
MDVVHFKSAAEFRKWLQKNHDRAKEVWVGFYRKESGRGGLTYKEALDQALCFGWIDGIRKKVDEESYTNRFTPRQAKSAWSLINIKRVEELTGEGLMAEPGLAAFNGRDPTRSGIYSFENRPKTLTRELERLFRANEPAYEFFRAQPAGYRRLATWFVMSAKKDDTRQRRLERLIVDSAAGRRLGIMTPAPKKAR